MVFFGVAQQCNFVGFVLVGDQNFLLKVYQSLKAKQLLGPTRQKTLFFWD
jgi:hypothetical protein